MKKIRYLLLTTAITASCFFPDVFAQSRDSAQTQVVDSLENILKIKPLTYEEQIKLLEEILNRHEGKYIEKQLKYTKKGLALAEKEKDKETMMNFCIGIGLSYDILSKHDSAFIYYEKVRILVEETKNKEEEIKLYRCMANSYYKQGKYAKALEYSMKVLRLSEITGDKEAQKTALCNIGSLHREMNNPDVALQYLEKVRVLIEDTDFTPDGILRYELGLIYLEQGKLDLALEYELQAVNLCHIPMNCYCMEALAKIYLKKQDYNQAMYYADKSLNIAVEFGDKQVQGDMWAVLSDIYLAQKRYKEAETMALKAWEIDSLSLKSGHHIAYNLAQSNLFLGNKEKASVFLEKYNDILKRYNDKNFHETFAGMEIQYETEKKELRITALEKERDFYIWLGIAGGALLLSLLLLLILRNRIKKQQIKQLEQETQIVATQAILDGETKERKRIASELHDSLGAMLSAVKHNLSDVEHLRNAHNLLDQSISEVRRIAHCMMPESLLRYGLKASLEDFCLSLPNVRFHYFGDDNRIEEQMEITIYRCTQELVHNATKYSGAENINVQLVQDANRISLTVQDNGCGFDVEETSKLGVSTGTGLKNLRDRIAAYNGKINIYSSPGKGTEVYIEINKI